jgi:hypothetical protein
MWFLVRMAFWLGLVALLLPDASSSQGARTRLSELGVSAPKRPAAPAPGKATRPGATAPSANGAAMHRPPQGTLTAADLAVGWLGP